MRRRTLRRRYGRAETRSYEYIVYPECRVAGAGVHVEGFGEKAFQRAVQVAKTHWGQQWGAGIYSISRGGFVSYVGRSGRMVPIGRGR